MCTWLGSFCLWIPKSETRAINISEYLSRTAIIFRSSGARSKSVPLFILRKTDENVCMHQIWQNSFSMEGAAAQDCERYRYYQELLQKTGKIEKTAILDFNGNILISTAGFELGPRETSSILRAIESQYLSLIKLKIQNQVFTCFRNDSLTPSLIGRAEDDVISAYKCVDFIVVGISDPDSPGSCIYEMQKFVKKCFRQSRRRTNSQW